MFMEKLSSSNEEDADKSNFAVSSVSGEGADSGAHPPHANPSGFKWWIVPLG
jgi:hypothetical protein